MATFGELWEHHPTTTGEPPVLDTAVYTDQCAINVGAAMLRAGLDFKSYTGVLSWQKDKPKYPIRATELANWLDSRMVFSKRATVYTGKEVFDKIAGKTGVIYLADYWQRSPGGARDGDHIDLWNGRRMTGLLTWARVQMGLSWDGFMTDFRKAPKAMFWAVQ